MAQRRMFSPKIVASDAFLDMPTSSRELYFQLGMYADDDGFINPRKIVRMVGASEDDLKMLIAKRFVIPFENGVVVIKHWAINNLIRKDWYQPTVYIEQKSLLTIKENGSYTDKERKLVNNPLTEVRLGKVSIVNSIGDKSPLTLKEVFIKEIGSPNQEGSKFLDYWTEKNPNGKKERWQMQKVFDIKRRWTTWQGNQKSFGKVVPTESPVICSICKKESISYLRKSEGIVCMDCMKER